MEVPQSPSILVSLGIVVLIVAALIAGLSVYAFLNMFRRRGKTDAEVREALLAQDALDAGLLAREWHTEEIPSPNGYGITVRGLRGKRPRIMVFSHGITYNWLQMLKYARVFSDAGWTVVAYDGRGFGQTASPESGARGIHCSFGVRERDDLSAVIDWALKRFEGAEGVALFGVSLGGAVSLQCAGRDPRPGCVISDCAFSSAREQLAWGLRKALRRGLAIEGVKALTGILVRLIDGYRLEEADPARASLATGTDILFIHGASDTYVPWKMAEDMARARREAMPEARTELVLFKGAAHALSRASDPETYDTLVLAFAESALDRRNTTT